jgi:biopolymer transport protein TolR
MLTVGVDVRLPETAADPLPGEDEEPLTVTLTADGGIVLMSTPVAGADLIARLRAVQAERGSARIYLRADGALPYDRVMRVMGALNASGFADIALVTESGGPISVPDAVGDN